MNARVNLPKIKQARKGCQAVIGMHRRISTPSEEVLAAKRRLSESIRLNLHDETIPQRPKSGHHVVGNIIGMGAGEKLKGGKATTEHAVRVYVARKLPLERLSPDERIPTEVDGIPTDVVETGVMRACSATDKFRPAPAGVSVGHVGGGAGTIACLVTKGGALFILSNNHVLADCNRATLRDLVLQPAAVDSAFNPADPQHLGDAVGRLFEYEQINFGTGANVVDCAIAQTNPNLVEPNNLGYGRINPTILPASLSLRVEKFGRTTSFTVGIIVDTNASMWVDYGSAGQAFFQNQIMVQSETSNAFAFSGDSGALLVDAVERHPVGLLFSAGDGTFALANPIDEVLSRLNVTLFV